MPDFLVAISEFVNSTQIPEQLREVDVKGLFTNVYFLIPFLAVLGHIVYRKAFKNFVLLLAGFGVWVFSGSPYMDNLIVNGELQIDKILPLVGAGIVVISVVVYIVFVRE